MQEGGSMLDRKVTSGPKHLLSLPSQVHSST